MDGMEMFSEEELAIIQAAEDAGFARPLTSSLSTPSNEAEDEVDTRSYHGMKAPLIQDQISATEWVKTIVFVTVLTSRSSKPNKPPPTPNISQMAYDRRDKALIVRFSKGPTYIYSTVTAGEAIALFNDSQLGKKFYREFRNHPCVRL